MTSAPYRRVIVTIDDRHLDNMEAIVSDLKAAGMEIADALHSAGIVTGEVSPENLAKVRQVNGIIGVEQDGTMDAI
jgi:hypothetical protein